MDRVVRVFSGGTVSGVGEFDGMKEDVVVFANPPSLESLLGRSRELLNINPAEDVITLEARFDAGGARSHYVMMKISTEFEWTAYKECVAGSQVRCAEVVVTGSQL